MYMIHFFIYIFLNLQYIIHSIPLSLQQVVGWHQNAPESTKDWLKKVVKTQGAICICHDLH